MDSFLGDSDDADNEVTSSSHLTLNMDSLLADSDDSDDEVTSSAHLTHTPVSAGGAEAAQIRVCPFCSKPGHTTKRSTKCGRHHEYNATRPSKDRKGSKSKKKEGGFEWEYHGEADEYVLLNDVNGIDAAIDAKFFQHVDSVVNKIHLMISVNAEIDSDSDSTSVGVTDSLPKKVVPNPSSRLEIYERVATGLFTTIFTWVKRQASMLKIKSIQKWEFYSWISMYMQSELKNYNMEYSIEDIEANYVRRYTR